jgi:hypothetical protein
MRGLSLPPQMQASASNAMRRFRKEPRTSDLRPNGCCDNSVACQAGQGQCFMFASAMGGGHCLERCDALLTVKSSESAARAAIKRLDCSARSRGIVSRTSMNERPSMLLSTRMWT